MENCSEKSETSPSGIRRRRFLQAGLAGSAVLLAGCLDDDPDFDDPYEVGESFESGDFEYEVTRAEVDDTVTFPGGQRFGGGDDEYGVRVAIDMTNVTDEDVDVPTTGSGLDERADVPLWDDEEREYEPIRSGAGDWTVAPGLTSSVDTVYEVSRDVEELYVQLDDEVVQIYDG